MGRKKKIRTEEEWIEFKQKRNQQDKDYESRKEALSARLKLTADIRQRHIDKLNDERKNNSESEEQKSNSYEEFLMPNFWDMRKRKYKTGLK